MKYEVTIESGIVDRENFHIKDVESTTIRTGEADTYDDCRRYVEERFGRFETVGSAFELTRVLQSGSFYLVLRLCIEDTEKDNVVQNFLFHGKLSWTPPADKKLEIPITHAVFRGSTGGHTVAIQLDTQIWSTVQLFKSIQRYFAKSGKADMLDDWWVYEARIIRGAEYNYIEFHTRVL